MIRILSLIAAGLLFGGAVIYGTPRVECSTYTATATGRVIPLVPPGQTLSPITPPVASPVPAESRATQRQICRNVDPNLPLVVVFAAFGLAMIGYAAVRR